MSHSEIKYSFPIKEEGIIRFLAGNYIEGIGPVFAARIVDRFGSDSLRVISEEPERLKEIPGLGDARISEARESLDNLKYPADLLCFLYSCDIGDTFIERILNKYRKKTAERIIDDPYSMVEDVWQLSFFTADKIGRASGISPCDSRRLRGALVTAVKHYAEGGHLFATPHQAVEYASRITGADGGKVEEQIEATVKSGRLVASHEALYLPVFYKAEKEGAEKIRAITAHHLPPVKDNDIPEKSQQGHTYSPVQREAIHTILESPVAVLTGGPGSGKTTVLKAVIDILEKNGKKVVLAAPTGRAAKRMSLLTAHEASTIHRLLGYRQGEGYHTRHLDADALIIDEGSMMEQVLFNHLLDAIAPTTRVILVGDTDQLPAIGAGDVMHDLIESGAVAVARLSENFRQEEGSLIAAGAQSINSGKIPHSDPHRDFMIIPESSPRRIHDRIISLISEELPQTKGIDPAEILVVTPQQIGILGARQLNSDLQQRLNPSSPGLVRGGTVMREGDPVMQTANSKDRGVYNGETGRIIAVDTEAQTLTVRYADGHESTYRRSELSELTLAYATTVHKLQGSEARNIIFPVTMAHKPMLYRNLLYTGVSRATELCILVGEQEALEYAVSNTPASRRNSNFGHRLKDSENLHGVCAEAYKISGEA